jgi:hypothetical protein
MEFVKNVDSPAYPCGRNERETFNYSLKVFPVNLGAIMLFVYPKRTRKIIFKGQAGFAFATNVL